MTTQMPDLNKIFPPDTYECVPNVAVFKTHKRHKGGKLITVEKADLERIANNHNTEFVKLLRASPFCKGHTLDNGPDGADVPEEAQPDVVGFGVKFHVDKIASDPEDDYLFCDLYIMKDKKEVLRQYPSISPEYYPSLNRLYPISFLKSSAPELTLPPVLHRYGLETEDNDEPYKLTMTNPIAYTNQKEKVDMDKDKKDDKDDDKAVKEAESKETKGAKEDNKAIAELQEQVAEIMQVMPAIKELLEMLSGAQDEESEGDEGKDKGDKKEDKDEGKDMMMPAGKDKPEVAADNVNPVKFDSSAATATNVSVPSISKKEEYTVDNEELVKYKAEVETQMQALKAKASEAMKLAEELNKKNRRAEAEKLVYKLENEFNVVFANDKVREEEIEALTELDPDTAAIYYERAKVRYQKKTPNAAAVKEVVKYTTENPDDIKNLTPEESQKLADKLVSQGLTMNQYLDSLRNKKN